MSEQNKKKLKFNLDNEHRCRARQNNARINSRDTFNGLEIDHSIVTVSSYAVDEKKIFS